MRTTWHLLLTFTITGAMVSVAEWADPEVGTYRRREMRRDAGWMALYLLYAPWVALLALASARLARRHSPFDAPLASASAWTRVVVAVVAAELAFYALHRWFHATKAGWWVHRVHHSSTDLHWWSSFRFHPLETLAITVVPATVAAWFGAGTAAIAYTLAATVVTTFAHADVYVPGRGLDHVVCTPGYHRSHHETGRERSNYALVLPLVDIAFGTASFVRGDHRRFGSAVTAAAPRSSATQCWRRPRRRARRVPAG